MPKKFILCKEIYKIWKYCCKFIRKKLEQIRKKNEKIRLQSEIWTITLGQTQV